MKGPPSPPTPPVSDWHQTETYKGLITLSMEALKTVALINSGAAVAVLTYLGHLASPAVTPPQLPAIKPAMLWYCGGLIAAVVALIVAYLTQLQLYSEGRSGGQSRQLHFIGIIIGCFLALFGTFAFGMGCWDAADALTAGHRHSSAVEVLYYRTPLIRL